MTVFNFGSINIDIVYRVAHIPGPGETILSSGISRGLGGKGANTSIALAQGGARVRHVGAIAAEDVWVLRALGARGVDCDLVMELNTDTGHAIILLADDGENAITVAPGANHAMPEAVLDPIFAIAGPGDWLVIQNETAHVRSAARRAREHGLNVAYAAAPFDAAAIVDILGCIDFLAVNEVEADQLMAFTGADLSGTGVAEILVTKGARGATVWRTSQAPVFEPAARVEKVVDTTCAGDTFFGFYLANRIKAKDIAYSMRVASVAAACAVQVAGAADSIPSGATVERRLAALAGGNGAG